MTASSGQHISISKCYQAPKCIIKAKDPCLHRISIAAPVFLISNPIPKGTLTTNLIPEGIPKVALPPLYTAKGATSSHPAIIKEEEKEEKEIVEVFDSEDEFDVFNQPLSSEASTGDLEWPFTPILDEMGIQLKSRSTLLELIESQPGRDTPKKVAQTKPPTFPPTQPLRHDPTDLKRKREQKGKEVVEGGKTHPSQEDEAQRTAKQAKVGQKGAEQRVDLQVTPPVWTPTPILDKAPLPANASIRDF